MTIRETTESALKPYRVLDLTEGGCLIGARTLGDLGADVIKIEKPGGSPSRISPYYKDIPDPEKSLFWFAYCANKRGITLDIEKAQGQEIFKKLAMTADIIIESFKPGYMDSLGLGYSSLCSVKPDIILTSITWFGQSGPKSRFKGCELAAWASGAYLYISGDTDRPPVWISFPQACLNGGVEAASGSLAALHYRGLTGEGQHVDVSIQECVLSFNLNNTPMWDVNKYEVRRVGAGIIIPTGVRFSLAVHCKDGYATLYIMGGGSQPLVNSMNNLVRWMDEEGMAPDWLRKMDWRNDYDALKITQELINKVESTIEQFTSTKTKAEFYEEVVKREVVGAPMATTKDIWENPQLRARDFWVEVQHPELGEKLTYCGPSVKLSETPLKHYCRAPLIGEHNQEIYEQELGISKENLAMLHRLNII